jgi:hypothetical protein
MYISYEMAMDTYLLKVSASSESMYDDAYTLQRVVPEDVHNFNYVAGMVPFLFNLIQDVCILFGDKKSTSIFLFKRVKMISFVIFQLQMEPQLNAKKTHGIITVSLPYQQ